jgi:uncharacterized protein (TIGR04255 family)
MPIPTSPRVRFSANPLAEVICQLRFPRLLEIDQQLPVDYQIALRSRFPELQVQQQVVFEIASEGMPPTQRIQPSYDFISSDGTRRISLNSGFVALTYSQYETWEAFVDDLRFMVKNFLSFYEVPYFTRSGLRYVDVLDRESLGIAHVPWRDLVRPELLGSMGNEIFDESEVREFTSVIVGKTEVGQLRLAAGLVNIVGQEGRLGLTIDTDFFSEQRIGANVNECTNLFDQYNKKAGDIFRWCLKESLVVALQPMA